MHVNIELSPAQQFSIYFFNQQVEKANREQAIQLAKDVFKNMKLQEARYRQLTNELIRGELANTDIDLNI